MTDINLTTQGWEILMSPKHGACLLTCRYRGFDILRPALPRWRDTREPTHTACFPLLPFSNRIKNGQFILGDEVIHLPQNVFGQRHPLHGHGWFASWHVERVSGNTVTVSYEHTPDAWPWAYRAEYGLRVEGDHMHISLTLKNLSGADMPAGLGFHPYFPHVNDASLIFEGDGVWISDDEVLPSRHVDGVPEWDFRAGRSLKNFTIDNCFTGFRGNAKIDWNNLPFSVSVKTSANLDHCVLYVPLDGDYFCFEPVNHMNNALNSQGLIGATPMPLLPPGHSAVAQMTLSVHTQNG